MRRERVLITCLRLAWFFLLLRLEDLHTNAEEAEEYSKGCSHLQCESGSRCIKRRFWCKIPPCPGMLYCSKSRKESLKGPETCDTVRCSEGYVCIIRVRGCYWGEKCQQQIARCISEREYYEGPASCVGFKCPSGERCILREEYCILPPCKLIRSCAKAKDAQIWFDKCRELDCLSEYECFLRKPNDDCHDASCIHTPDCTITAEDELINEHCRGWVCPQTQKCVVKIVGSCRGFNCAIERSCRALISLTGNTNGKIPLQSSTERTLQIETVVVRQEPEKHEMNTSTSYPITRKKVTSATTSTKEQPDYTTLKIGTSKIYQRLTTISSLITKPAELSLKELPSTLSFRYSLNPDESSTTIAAGNEFKITDNVLTATSTLTNWSENSSLPETLLTDSEVKSTISRDTKKLGMPKIYTDGALSLSMVLDGIDVVEQGYPIWIEIELNRATPTEAEEKNDDSWRNYASQNSYRSLLPPYEPAFFDQDNVMRGQFFPFNPFNEAISISSQKVTSRGATESWKNNNSPMVNDKDVSDLTVSTITENLGANYFDESSGDYVPSFVVENADTPLPNIRDKKVDNYRDNYKRIGDYPEKGISIFTYRNGTVAGVETLTGSQITKGSRDRVSEMRHTYRRNKSLATHDLPWVRISMERSDYSSQEQGNEKHYSSVNYPYNAITVRYLNQSSGYQEFPLEIPKSEEKINQASEIFRN